MKAKRKYTKRLPDKSLQGKVSILDSLYKSIAKILIKEVKPNLYNDWKIKIAGLFIFIDADTKDCFAEIEGTHNWDFSSKLRAHLKLLSYLEDNYLISEAIKLSLTSI